MQTIHRFVKHWSIFWVLIFILTALTLVSCGPAEETPTYPAPDGENGPPDQNQGYPPPDTSTIPESAYPAPEDALDGTLLALDKPISAGDTEVTGVGPAGLTVYLLNITFMGEQLGSAVVKGDGTFSIAVNPLPSGVRIGLTADPVTAGLNSEDVRPGEEQISVPRVGYFYDSFVIMNE